MGTSHERKTDNHSLAEAMDLHNNEVGRQIAAAHPDASRKELLAYVQQAERNGELVVISEDATHLEWSDQVAPGSTGSTVDNWQDDPRGRFPGSVGDGQEGSSHYAF